MSLPLTRRIARAALLVAAGAAPVVGAAGSASAVELPARTDLAGLSTLDKAGDVTENVTTTAAETSGKTVKKAVPAANGTVKKTTPVVKDAAGQVAGSAGEVVGEATKGGQLPAKGLPLG